MIKGKLVFKTQKQAGNVVSLLNEIYHAALEKRSLHFYRAKKAVTYEINTKEEQEKFDKMFKKLKMLKI